MYTSWEVSSLECLHIFSVAASCVTCLTAFRAQDFVTIGDQEVLAAGTADGSVFFFSLTNMAPLHVLLVPASADNNQCDTEGQEDDALVHAECIIHD